MLFLKANITIEASREIQDSITRYTFKLKEKKIPDSIVYAEDLLQFDSHEFLVAYFGIKNVIGCIFLFFSLISFSKGKPFVCLTIEYS